MAHRLNYIQTDAAKLREKGSTQIGGITYTHVVNGVGKEDQDPAKAGTADIMCDAISDGEQSSPSPGPA